MFAIKIVALNERNQSDILGDILELWNSNFAEQYRITENMLKDKVFEDQDLFRKGSFLLYGDTGLKGFIFSKTNVCGLPGCENCGWISSMLVDREIRGRGYGKELYSKAEAQLSGTGIKKVLAGGECNNFFSGIPDPTPQNVEFFRKRGFVINGDEHYDLMADVSAIDFEGYNPLVNCEESYFSEVLEPRDFNALDSFFEKCFPDRWRFEVMSYLENGGDPGNVIALKYGSEIVGFCRINISSSPDDVILYGPSRGSLGPIGVSEAVRGKGLGKKILLDSLKILKQREARNVIIDWTILKDFYGQFGFNPWRTYRGAYKTVE